MVTVFTAIKENENGDDKIMEYNTFLKNVQKFPFVSPFNFLSVF